jgi:hypothetical protein
MGKRIRIENLCIYPTYLFYKHEVFKVTKIKDTSVAIRSCEIYTNDDNMIQEIYIDNLSHPNCDPKTGKLCKCPLHGQYYNGGTIDELKLVLSQYNLNSCYDLNMLSKLSWI